MGVTGRKVSKFSTSIKTGPNPFRPEWELYSSVHPLMETQLLPIKMRQRRS